MFDQHRLRAVRTDAAGAKQPSERRNEMNEKDSQIAHLPILTKPGIGWGCVVSRKLKCNPVTIVAQFKNVTRADALWTLALAEEKANASRFPSASLESKRHFPQIPQRLLRLTSPNRPSDR
jgi:hypothetical protein